MKTAVSILSHDIGEIIVIQSDPLKLQYFGRVMVYYDHQNLKLSSCKLRVVSSRSQALNFD
ncbi:MAG: hypothetical protein V7K35_19280 [Nostoc sp.]